MRQSRPAYSDVFAKDKIQPVQSVLPAERITRKWAWGGSTGNGVRVGILDSGIDNDHPAVAGHVVEWASFSTNAKGRLRGSFEPHGDQFGHGTACADIVRRVAHDARLISVKVLGDELSGSGITVASGLRWCIDNNVNIVNISLGVMRKNFAMLLYELADKAYFKNMVLVTAANNMPVPSYPSLFASVISVACHDSQDPYEFLYNPKPPVEFSAPGINLKLAWANGGALTATGNSFAAPHITGLVARILGKHPGLTPFQVKTVLRATANNVIHD